MLGLFASTEKLVPLGWLHTREAQHCIFQHWHFDALTSNTWIPLSPTAEEKLQWWMSAHNVLRVAPVTLTEPDTQLFTDASNIGWGAHWNALTVSGVWTTTEKRTRVRSHSQSHVPLAVEAYGSESPGCVRQLHCSVLHQQAGRNTINTAVQTDQEMCQGNQIVLRARHIPGRLNILAEILSRPSQMSGTECSQHPSSSEH